MQPASPSLRRCVLAVILITVVWGINTPATKAFFIEQAAYPGAIALSALQIAAILVVGRSAISALFLTALQPRALRGIQRLELEQAALLTLCSGAGMLVGADAVSSADASAVGFLIQFTCVFVLLLTAIGQRRFPSARVIGCALLVLIGAAVLVGLDWRRLSFGSGEFKAIGAAFIFAVDILLVNAPRYRDNRSLTTSILIFFFVAIVMLAAFPALGIPLAGIGRLWHSPFATVCWLLTAFIAFALASWIMFHYQRRLPAAEVGIIHAFEGVFTATFCLFLPEWFAAWGGFEYPNEQLTWHLVVGGGLITAANVWLQWPGRSVRAG